METGELLVIDRTAPASHVRSPHRYVAITLATIWIILIAASVTQDTLKAILGIDFKIWILDLDLESGIYTWFSSKILFISSILIEIIAVHKFYIKDELIAHWIFLSIIFMVLSIDEHVSLHEKFSGFISVYFKTSGLFNFAWVMPSILACGIGLFFYIPFISSFPPPLRFYLCLSAVGFLTGAIGMEMLGGAVAEQGGEVRQGFAYRSLVTVEEALEGGSVVLFIAVLLAYGARIGAIRSPVSPVAHLP